jgi:hypothetical protein
MEKPGHFNCTTRLRLGQLWAKRK